MKTTALSALLTVGLCACATVPTDLDDAPRASTDLRHQAGGNAAFDDVVEFGGELLAMTAPGPVRMSEVAACELADVVFSGELGLRVGCTDGGEGRVSIYSDFQSPLQLFQLAVATLRAAGVSVSVFDGLVTVSEPASRDSSGNSGGDLLDGLTGVDQPPEGMVLTDDEIDLDAAQRAVETLAGSASIVMRGEASDLQALGDDAGLNITAAQVGDGWVAVVGSPDHVRVIQQVASVRGVSSVSMPLVGDLEALTLIGEEYGVLLTEASDGLFVVSGQRDAVALFSGAVRRLGLYGGQRSIRSAFVSGTVNQVRAWEASITGGTSLGSLAVNVGAVTDFSAFLDHTATNSRIDIRSEPSLVVRDGSPASFVSGREVPVASSIDEDGRQSIEFREVGTRVSVTTFPRPASQVLVVLELEVSAVDGVGLDGNPTFASRVLQTSVVVSPGDVIVLSGFSSVETDQTAQRSIFSPRFGGGTDRTELSFVLTVQ